MSPPAEPLEEQLLAAVVTRLATAPPYYYTPRFVTRTYRMLDEVNELPGYLVLPAPEETGADPQTLEEPGATVIASMGLEVLAYGQGTDQEPASRVLYRLLAQAERALVAPLVPWSSQVNCQNTRRTLAHEAEVGAPWRMLMSHLYRIRYLYTRGEP